VRVGLVADTHLLPRGGVVALPPALLRGLAGCAAILHAGDVACREVLEALAAVAPVHAVAGNVDDPGLGLPAQLLLQLGGRAVGLAHGHAGPGRTVEEKALRACPGAEVVVFGHTHRPLVVARAGGPLLVNPGSPTKPRGLPPTFALLDLSGPRPQARLVRLSEVDGGSG